MSEHEEIEPPQASWLIVIFQWKRIARQYLGLIVTATYLENHWTIQPEEFW
jgi:hypothetical protein